MKKVLFGFTTLLLAVAGLLSAKLVFAHHNTITQTASCQGYNVAADYVGGSEYRRVVADVDFTLDGVLELINSDWRGQSNGFNIFTRTGSGSHSVVTTGTVKMYSCDDTNPSDSSSNGSENLWTDGSVYKCDQSSSGSQNHNDDSGWELIETDTFNLNFNKNVCGTPTPVPTSVPTVQPTTTPTVEPTYDPCAHEQCETGTPVPTIDPCDGPCPTESPIPTETPTPTEEPTSTPLVCSGTQHLDASGRNCVDYSFGGPGSSTGTGGGQVLGASTMAGTGSFFENLYMAIMSLGGILTFQGLKNFKKAYKKA